MITVRRCLLYFFFFNDTATTEIYTLSLHDALPISLCQIQPRVSASWSSGKQLVRPFRLRGWEMHREESQDRSEEHTSELQSRLHLVCRLLLEKKKRP